MWRPWRKSSANETDLHHQQQQQTHSTSQAHQHPYEPCEAPAYSSMTTYTTLTPRNSLSSSTFVENGHHLIHRNAFTSEQPEALTIKSDCESLSDDELRSSTGSDCYRTRFYYDSPISGSPPPLVYYPLERSYNDLGPQSIPTLPVASPEVLNFIKQRDLDRLVDRIENYNCTDTTLNSFIIPRTMVDNETTEPFISSEDDAHTTKPSTGSVNCYDGLTLLSALAEQRALEEESRLESERTYPYPYPIDFRPSDLLTTPSPMINLKRLSVDPTDRLQPSIERPISTSSTDFNIKEDENCCDEPTFEPQINIPIATTSPPPPLSVLSANHLHLHASDTISKPSSISPRESKDSSFLQSLPSPSTLPSPKSASPLKPSSGAVAKAVKSPSSVSSSSKPKSKAKTTKSQPNPDKSTLTSTTATKATTSKAKSTKKSVKPLNPSSVTSPPPPVTPTTSETELPLKKRKRELSTTMTTTTSNPPDHGPTLPSEYNFTRRSERLFVLDSYALYGIQPPDARKELFEKTPSKSKKSSQKARSEDKSSTTETETGGSTTTSSTYANNNSITLKTSSQSSSLSSSTPPINNTSTCETKSSSTPPLSLTRTDSCHQPDPNNQKSVISSCDAKSEETYNGKSPLRVTGKNRKGVQKDKSVNNKSNNHKKPVKENVCSNKLKPKSKAKKPKVERTSANNGKPQSDSNGSEEDGEDEGEDDDNESQCENDEWNWSGPGVKKMNGKPKTKKIYYKEISRGNELIRIGDCAVFCSRAKLCLPFDLRFNLSNSCEYVMSQIGYCPRIVFTFALLLTVIFSSAKATSCQFPAHWAGTWFQKGLPKIQITSNSISDKGNCTANEKYKFLIYNRTENCARCMAIIEKHYNVLQYKETYCAPIPRNLNDLCEEINGDAPLLSLFRLDTPPVECPFSGYFKFRYNRGRGDCIDPPSTIDSCTDENHLLFRFQACTDIQGSESKVVTLECYATWKGGSIRYLVGKFLHPSAKDEDDRFHCFVFEQRNETTYHLAQSADASCDGLEQTLEGSATMLLTRTERLENRCSFPDLTLKSRFWQTIDGLQIYDFGHEGSFRVYSKFDDATLRFVNCTQQDPMSDAFVVYSTTKCEIGYVCMKLVRRSDNIIEIIQGDLVKSIGDACLGFTKYDYTTLTAYQPNSDDGAIQCPLEGIYNVNVQDNVASLRSSTGFPLLTMCSDRSVIVSKCLSPNQMRFELSCGSNEPTFKNFHCNGLWSDNGTNYLLIYSPDDETQFCLSYSETESSTIRASLSNTNCRPTRKSHQSTNFFSSNFDYSKNGPISNEISRNSHFIEAIHFEFTSKGLCYATGRATSNFHINQFLLIFPVGVLLISLSPQFKGLFSSIE